MEQTPGNRTRRRARSRRRLLKLCPYQLRNIQSLKVSSRRGSLAIPIGIGFCKRVRPMLKVADEQLGCRLGRTSSKSELISDRWGIAFLVRESPRDAAAHGCAASE